MLEKRFFAVFVVVLGLSVTMAFAAGGNLAGSLEAFRVVVTDDGVEDFLPADNARPNDTIEYRLTYTNTGDTGGRRHFCDERAWFPVRRFITERQGGFTPTLAFRCTEPTCCYSPRRCSVSVVGSPSEFQPRSS